MFCQKTIQHIRQLDRLLRNKVTGKASDLAKELGVGRTTVFEYLKLMKELGAPIKYCKLRQTFYYEEEGRFIIQFSTTIEENSEFQHLHIFQTPNKWKY
ncbi:helix-turn-helix domain-containing protein [Niastella populi]|uniref:Helix-turn-helix type 11 domain-containing protein n=1 Tax=Niastella populi TaxID=550983 RepID=A0A1V9GAN6_9BACT|nr:helix-turn-helix domain-containing protein [Niastella populi]OQP67614.1 hypothetical protein A4R26_12440 [Niastella populi]